MDTKTDIYSLLQAIGMVDKWVTLSDISNLLGIHATKAAAEISDIYAEKELDPVTTRQTCKSAAAASAAEDWLYSIDVLIALIFRLQSVQARDVRRQFTRILGEFAVKGFMLDDERLKNGSPERLDALEVEAASMVKH